MILLFASVPNFFSHSETRMVGQIGLGLAGGALATRLRQAGFQTNGFDPAAEAARKYLALGGQLEPSGRAVAAKCRVLVFSLPGPEEVRSVLEEIGPCLQPGHLIIDTTTGDPESVEGYARDLAATGVEYLDATLGGSSRQIASGDAVVMCGASEAGFERAREIVGCLGHPVFHTGPPGSGTRMKLVMNLVLGLQRAVLAEGLEFARKSGIDPERALEILRSGPSYSAVMDTKGRKMVAQDFLPEARLVQHWKDVQLILAAAAGNGARLPLTAVHDDLLRSAYEAGWGLEDNSAIIKVYQEKLQ